MEPQRPFVVKNNMAVSLSGITIRHVNHKEIMQRQSFRAFPETVVKIRNVKTNGVQHKSIKNGRVRAKLFPMVAFAQDQGGPNDINISSPSPSEAIMQFYNGINGKNLKELDKLFSDDCFMEDFSFIKPFQGKKELMKYLQQLIESMGQNMEFNVEHICEGDDLTAAVKWHLEWKKKQVPFTRGCSYYELSRQGERLLIERIQVVIESPMKPGTLALALLKMITSVFDAFPEPAERFLRSPHIIFQVLLKVYSIIIQPIVNPILSWYLKLWSFTVGIITFTLKMLQYIATFLNM